MLNKFDAIKYFCSAAETLNFRETANRFAVSPSVITRVINELEETLGEPLFKRSTRHISLTDFGEQFLPNAKQLWQDSEKLFQPKQKRNEMAGIVRITVPSFRHNDEVLAELLTALESYPELIIDWREGMEKADQVREKIDIGLRIGLEPDPNFIVRKIAEVGDLLVASRTLVAQLGEPTDLADFEQRYPFAVPINVATGRAWDLMLNETDRLQPRKAAFMASDPYSPLQAVRLGKAAGLISDFLAKPYLQSGEWVQLLPQIPIEKWQLYLYRPYQQTTPARVRQVFELLEEILKKHWT